MTNVGEELREHFEEIKRHGYSTTVRCIFLHRDWMDRSPSGKELPKFPSLKEGHDLEKFLEECDKFEYDSGYGIQYLYGVIWYTDGTYSDRHEYDGSEYWVYRTAPEIPPRLLNEHKQTGQDTTSLQVKRENLN